MPPLPDPTICLVTVQMPVRGVRLSTSAVEEDVLVQLENLRTLPAVARLVRGDLHRQGWVYKIDTGVLLHAKGNLYEHANMALSQSV